MRHSTELGTGLFFFHKPHIAAFECTSIGLQLIQNLMPVELHCRMAHLSPCMQRQKSLHDAQLLLCCLLGMAALECHLLLCLCRSTLPSVGGCGRLRVSEASGMLRWPSVAVSLVRDGDALNYWCMIRFKLLI